MTEATITDRKRARRKASRKAAPAGETEKPWTERQGNARPTEQRWRRGSMRLVAGEDAGVKVAYDDDSTPLRNAFRNRQISQRQLTAGEKFEALCRANLGSPSPRSCLDWSPRGHDESVSEYAIRARAAWKEACWSIGLETSYILISVCFHHEGTGPRRNDARRWKRLTEGLSILGRLWGV